MDPRGREEVPVCASLGIEDPESSATPNHLLRQDGWGYEVIQRQLLGTALYYTDMILY